MCVPVEMMGVDSFCAAGALVDWGVFFVLMLKSWTGVLFVILLKLRSGCMVGAPVEFVESVCSVLLLKFGC